MATVSWHSKSEIRAIRILDYAGILEVRTRSGTYVSETALAKGIELRAHAALRGEESPLDTMVARRALEPVNARYAALNRHVRDLSSLKRSVRDQRRLIDRGDDPNEVDRDFHIAVAAASHNPILSLLFERVADVMHQRTWTELKHNSRSKGDHQERYLRQHHSILDAIERGDSAAASSAMLEHLDAVEEGLLEQLD
ncbi:MAG TPA: FCD domain-containing protein [Acidimicrobiales bacterium]|nr:FCD domain-containing protein [Acidimicrobiales bacterium]